MKSTSLIYSRPRDGKGPQTDKSTNGKLFGRSVLGERREGRDRDVYMVRYWFGPLRFHVMHRGDAGECPHDHPWWFITFPLTSYVEEILVERNALTGTAPRLEKRLNVVKALRLHFRPAKYAHRILGPLANDIRPSERAFHEDQYGRFIAVDDYIAHMSDSQLTRLREKYPTVYGRKIRTIVLRGPVKWSWGFYTDWKGSWIKAAEYFRRNNIQQ